MALSPYHAQYVQRSDEELANRVAVKKIEFTRVFADVGFVPPANDPIIVAILGCANRRYVPEHKRMLEELLQRPVDVTTYDITTEHLAGEEGIVQHDLTEPLDRSDIAISLAHVLLKFVPTEKQWNILKNSYDALAPGGIAIHIMGTEELGLSPGLKADQYPVPLDRWESELTKAGIPFQKIAWTIAGYSPEPLPTIALVLKKT